MKKEILWCENCLDEDKKRRAGYECANCDYPVCKKCEKDMMGECPVCEPRFYKITKKKK